MNEELFDKKIKELMESVRVEPDPDLWESIQSGLNKRRTHIRFRKITLYLSAVAAALVAGLFLLPEVKDRPSDANVLVAEIADDGSNSIQDTVFIAEVSENTYNPVTVVPAQKKELLADIAARHDVMHDVVQPVETTVELITEKAMVGDFDAVQEEEVLYDDSQYYGFEAESVSGKKGRKNGFSISANGLMSPSDASGNVDFSSPSFSSGSAGGVAGLGIKPISVPEHSFPVTVGIDAVYTFLKGRLGVGVGVNYTYMKSRYEAIINNAEQGVVQQSLHYIGVPVKFYVNAVSYKGFNLYASIGGTLEKGVKAIYNITNLENVRYTKESEINGVQWSANVGIGLEYRFLDFLGLYLDPHLTYYFDCGQPYSVRTEQNFQFGLQLGIRFII